MRFILSFAAIMLVALGSFPDSAHCETVQDGLELWNQGWELENKAASKDQLLQAVKKYQQALGIFERVGYAKGMWGASTNLGKIFCQLGDYEKGKAYYRQAVEIGEKSGQAKGKAHGLSGLGGAYFDLAQYDKATENYEQALKTYRELGDRKWEGLTLNHLGEVARESGKYSEATVRYRQALDIAKQIKSDEAEADVLLNLGELHRLKGRYNDAIQYYEEALAKHRKLGDRRHEAIALSSVGAVYEKTGQYSKALERYEQALKTVSGLGLEREKGRTLLRIGGIHHAKGREGEALAILQKGMKVYQQLGVSANVPAKLIADLYMDKGKVDKAEPFVRQADLPETTGRYNLLKGKYREARKHYERLLKSAKQSGNVDDLFTAHTGLGTAFEYLEDYNEAVKHFQKGMSITEEIRSSLVPDDRKNFFDVKINGFYRSDPAKGLTRVRLKLNEAPESILTSELTRARAFADRLSQRTAMGIHGVPKEVLNNERELITRIAALKQARAKVSRQENPDRHHNLTQQIDSGETELERFIDKLRLDYPAYAAIKYPQPVKLRESAIRDDEYVVVYDVVGRGLGVKLIKGKRILSTFYQTWEPGELEAKVLEFRKPFETYQLKRFDAELAKELYRRLLARVIVDVPEAAPITIVPDGILAVLPFEALVIRGKTNWQEGQFGPFPKGLTYVSDAHPVSYYQSITALTLARTLTRKKASGDRILVIADPVYSDKDERLIASQQKTRQHLLTRALEKLMSIKRETGMEFERLPMTGRLAESLKNTFREKTVLFVGPDARKSLLLKSPLNQYKSIVFATHGYFGNALPGIQEPVLVLSLPSATEEDAFLRMTEVMGLDLNADLAALTACQSGLGEQVSGEGTMGMGWAFQYAGAKSVLMSLWSVAEISSVRLVESLFKHLRKGDTKIRALAKARADIRAQGFEHPFFWAAFILVGEAR